MFDKARSMLHTGTCLVQIANCTVQQVYTEILQSPNTVQKISLQIQKNMNKLNTISTLVEIH